MTKNSGGKPIEIEYQRDGQSHVLTVQPVFSSVDAPARWMIGVIPQQKLRIITTKLSLPAAFKESVQTNSKGALLIVQFLKGMLERRPRTCPGRSASAPWRAPPPAKAQPSFSS
jgi:hypothetical protein